MSDSRLMQICAGFLCAAAALCGATRAHSPQSPLEKVAMTQRLGEAVPLQLTFTDESGKAVQLGSFFSDRPVVIVPVVYECAMLCTQVLNALHRTLQSIDLVAGRDFAVVVMSIDPRETAQLAAEKKLRYLGRHASATTWRAWHFLTGEHAPISQLTEAVGYFYTYDEQTRQFAHPAAVVVLTPQGRISRYVVGLDYSPSDLRLALIESSDGVIGSMVDRLLLRCYRYDPRNGRYGLAIATALQVGGALTVLLVATGILWLSRRPARAEDSPARNVGRGIR